MDNPNVAPDSLKHNKIITVSYYKTLTDKTNSQISVSDVFSEIKSGTGIKNTIQNLRAETEPKHLEILKKKLPSVTFSGLFQGQRTSDNLIGHTGLICLDFDKVADLFNVKSTLCNDPFTFSLFLSPTGSGIKLLVKVDCGKDGHNDTYKAIQGYFKDKYNLESDSKCRDITRLCFISYDQDIYINDSSVVFASLPAAAISIQSPKSAPRNEDVAKNVEMVIRSIEASQLDLTAGYENWRNLGFALADGMGEQGRPFFHRMSVLHSNYDRVEADQQFTKCLNGKRGGITIATFFHLAKKHGITIHSEKQKAADTSHRLDTQTETKGLTQNSALKPGQKSHDLPYITQVENFLNEYFEFRRNVINEKLEHRKLDHTGQVQEWQHTKENEISRFLQKHHFKYSPTKTSELLHSDYVREFNPITDYFKNLPTWNKDTEPSYIQKLAALIKVKDQERFNTQLMKMFIRCVACSTVTGYTNPNFNKHVFVIVNPNQSSGKSTLCRWFNPPTLQDYYIENLSSDKDGIIGLAQGFIINLDELASLSKQDVDHLKSFISRASINERIHYGRTRKFYPRRANFVGSTNNLEFLTDETGNVRWLCFEVEYIDFGYCDSKSEKYVDIDRLWAEAYFRYKVGEEFQLTTQERHENEKSNKTFQLITEEEELLNLYFEPAEKNKSNFLTNTQIIQKFGSKGISTNRLSKKKLGSVLRKLNYIQGEERIGLNPVKGYYLRELSNILL